MNLQKFTDDEFKIIRKNVEIRKSTDELCMLIYLLLETKLKVSQALGWFNHNLGKRRKFLKDYRTILLEDYKDVPRLFTKTRQAYLTQWKRLCLKWLGKKNVTFEMLKRTLAKQLSTKHSV
jgi:hypothetical protein